MIRKYRFELNEAGVRKLLKSPEMESHLTKMASGIQSRYGKGCEFETKQGKKRAYVNIYPETKEAKKDNKLLKEVRG